MEKANGALASFLCTQDIPVCLVANSVDDKFTGNSKVTVIGSNSGNRLGFLRRFSLARVGQFTARSLIQQCPDVRVVVNGINCNWPDINWVHWVHQCWRPRACEAPAWFKLKQGIESSLSTRIEHDAFRHTRLLVANSHRTRHDLISRLDIDPARVETIYPGSDSNWRQQTPAQRLAARAWLEIADERPLVAFIGALGYDGRKGFDTLWHAWKDLCHLPEWDADLVVAGGGRALGKWRRDISRAGLGPRVRLLGFTPRIADVLAASDLLVSPTRYEPYGLNVQEALCFGVPAMVTANAGVAERFSEDAAGLILRDPESASELVLKMIQWRETLMSGSAA
jgi:glycosyltransferase involved in cell wall biosynthesis